MTVCCPSSSAPTTLVGYVLISPDCGKLDEDFLWEFHSDGDSTEAATQSGINDIESSRTPTSQPALPTGDYGVGSPSPLSRRSSKTWLPAVINGASYSLRSLPDEALAKWSHLGLGNNAYERCTESTAGDALSDSSGSIWDVINQATFATLENITVDRTLADLARWTNCAHSSDDNGDLIYCFWSLVANAISPLQDPRTKVLLSATKWQGSCEARNGYLNGVVTMVENVEVAVGNKEYMGQVLPSCDVDHAFTDLRQWPTSMREAHCSVFYVCVNHELVGAISMSDGMTHAQLRAAENLHQASGNVALQL